MKKLLKKEVNHWLVFTVIFILITVASASIAVSAYAAAPLSFGGRIIKYTPACTLFSGCTMCGVGFWSEVLFIPFGGDTNYICPLPGFKPIGGMFTVGYQILGWSFSNFVFYGISQIGVSP